MGPQRTDGSVRMEIQGDPDQIEGALAHSARQGAEHRANARDLPPVEGETDIQR
ncbi:MAG: hypothetical protein R3B49_06300 [Phycisphaerales bacterium]